MHASFESPLPLYVTFTILLSIQCLSTPSTAQSPPTHPPPTVNIKPYASGRIFSASTESPIANTLSRDPFVVHATATILDYFKAIEDTVSSSLAVSRGQHPRHNNTVPVCNNRSIPWRSATINFAQHRGWPADWRRRCITDIYGTPQRFYLTDVDLDHLSNGREIAVDELRNDIINAAGLKNWTLSDTKQHSETDVLYGFNRGSQKCSINSLSGVRVHGLWYSSVGISNRPRKEWLPSGDRQYLTEYVRVKEGKLVSSLMTLPVNPVVGTVHRVETKSTTVLTRWGGAIEPSQYLPAAIEKNVALQDALDKGQHYLQQVEDATTGSNVAILSLPLLLSLVPISLITDVSRKRMLVYVVLSDVVTALPMWIKGVEVVGISNQKFISSVTRVGDVSVDEDVSVVLEVWMASCGSHDNVRVIGIGFIVAATVLMVIGVVLEIVVWTRQGGKRKMGDGQYEALIEEFDGEEWVIMRDDEEDKLK